MRPFESDIVHQPTKERFAIFRSQNVASQGRIHHREKTQCFRVTDRKDDVLNQAWSQIKWEEDPSHDKHVSSRTESRVAHYEKTPLDDKPYQRTRAGVTLTNLSLIYREKEIKRKFLAQHGQSFHQRLKHCSQKMTSEPETRDTRKWCDFHHDHSHRIEDCISLRIEVNKMLKKDMYMNSCSRWPGIERLLKILGEKTHTRNNNLR
ncbi:unnamed protein product [Cochlearia groenlandica]